MKDDCTTLNTAREWLLRATVKYSGQIKTLERASGTASAEQEQEEDEGRG
jgi:hypothetical protein